MIRKDERITSNLMVTRFDNWGILHARKCFSVKLFEKQYRKELSLKTNLGVACFGLSTKGDPVLLVNCLLIFGFDNIKNFFYAVKHDKKEILSVLSNADIGHPHYLESVGMTRQMFKDLAQYFQKECLMYRFGQIIIKRERVVAPPPKPCLECEEKKKQERERLANIAHAGIKHKQKYKARGK